MAKPKPKPKAHKKRDGANTTKQVLKSAPPTLPYLVQSLVIMIMCMAVFPPAAEFDKAATVDTIGRSSVTSLEVLAGMRLAFFGLIVAVFLTAVLGPGWDETTTYEPGSKLVNGIVRVEGLGVLMFFTTWSWNALGLYFGGSGLVSLLLARGQADLVPDPLLKLTFVAWQIAAPAALLVSIIVTFVIWPQLLEEAGPEKTKRLQLPIQLMQHCGNAAMVVSEFVLAETPLDLKFIVIAPLFGFAYVLFSWWWAPRAAPEYGAQYLYFFLDTTLGWKFSCVAQLGLLTVLTLAFCAAAGVDYVLQLAQLAGVPLLLRIAASAVCTLGICRFKD